MTRQTTAVLVPATTHDHAAIVGLTGLSQSTRRLMHRDLAGARPRHVVVARDPTGCQAGGHGHGDGGGDDAEHHADGIVGRDRIVAMAMTTCQPDEVHLLDIAVATAHRRRGIAVRLVGVLAAMARADGAEAMTLEVRDSNVGAIALYGVLGFTEAGRRPGYYRDGQDARIMWHHDLAELATLARPADVAACRGRCRGCASRHGRAPGPGASGPGTAATRTA